MGAIASGGTLALNEDVIELLGIPGRALDAVAARELREVERRESAYRDGRPAPVLAGSPVIVVDDGLATGSTMRAAVEALRRQRAGSITVAVPVGSREACSGLRANADHVVCLLAPYDFYAVGLWYEDFSQVSDDEVRELLARAAREIPLQGGAEPAQPPR
jgi:predicted phosphoribosyltransferase